MNNNILNKYYNVERKTTKNTRSFTIKKEIIKDGIEFLLLAGQVR